MKKRFIRVIGILLMVITLLGLSTSCSDISETTETITGTKTDVGSNSIFQTTDVNEYLGFLEDLDENKYEIIDISITLYARNTGRYIYIITYEKIAE